MMRGGDTPKIFKTSESAVPTEIVSSRRDITQCSELLTIDPDNLVGYKFVREFNGTPQRATVINHLEDEGRFLVEFVNGGEELMTYNDLINAFNVKDEERADLWTYEQITAHNKTKKGEWQVKVLWDTGDETWEPMKVIKEDDKLPFAKCAHDNNLVDQPRWKWARRLTKNPKMFIRMARIFAAQAKNHDTKYKHGVKSLGTSMRQSSSTRRMRTRSGRML